MYRRTLTAKQEAFAREYLVNGRNAASAYRTVYNTRCSPKIASGEGAKLLKHPGITLAVEQAAAKAAADLQITAERVIAEVARVAFFDPRRLYRSDGTLKQPLEWDDDTAPVVASMEVCEGREGQGENCLSGGLTKKVRFSDKVEALKLLMRHLGLLNGKGGAGRHPSYKVYIGTGMLNV
jgi:phage terminase small subunit